MTPELGDLIVLALLPLLLLLGIVAFAMACTRYPRRPRNGARR